MALSNRARNKLRQQKRDFTRLLKHVNTLHTQQILNASKELKVLTDLHEDEIKNLNDEILFLEGKLKELGSAA